MSKAAPNAECVQFGAFELDLPRRELRKQGRKIRLQEQPLKVLQVLVESPSRIVTREELKNRVWPADTFVEFDQGIYSAMARLRDALGDSSGSPRFIETVARRGYRFIAPVTVVGTEPVDEAPPAPRQRTAERSRTVMISLLAGLAGGAILLAIVLGFDVAGTRDWIRSPITPIRSIAVLPLEDLSADPEQEYFADGMTDELITTLAQVGTVRVVSRTSVMHYKKTTKPAAQVGRELNVDALIEGTVERSGKRVRIRVQLIQAASDRHLWAHTYDRDFGDALALQSEAARDIAHEIQATLSPPEEQRLAAARRVDPEAHEAYLKGLYFSNKRNATGFTRAIQYFNQAIAKDQGYAAAYSGLSDALLGEVFTGTPASRVREKATWAARKAIELDSSLAEAHNSLGGIREFWDWDWAAAEKEYRRAIELNPSFAAGHQDYAYFLVYQGRFEQGIEEARRAQELDPLSPFIRTTYSLYLSIARRYEEAAGKCQEALELDPTFVHAHTNLARIYRAMGSYDRAVEEYQRAASLRGESRERVAEIKTTFDHGGMRALWKKWVSQDPGIAGMEDQDPMRFAALYSLLDDREQSLSWLEKAYQERSPLMEFVKEEPDFDNLRSDPRFVELLHRVGLGT